MEHRGGEAKESGPCSISVSLGRYFIILKKQTADTELLGLLGEWTAKRDSSLGSRAESGTRCGLGRAQPAVRAMPEPCPHRASASRPARAPGNPEGTALLLWSHALLQHHLSQSWRVSPHQGTFREQSTWSKARASPRFLSQAVPPAQEPLQRCQFYLTVHFNSTSCLPGLDEGKLYFLQHL